MRARSYALALVFGLTALLLASCDEGDARSPGQADGERGGAERQDDGPPADAPHVVLVTVDALRADRLGLYGYERRELSPRLDAFAEQALVFEHAYAAAPDSSWSLCSLMTGEWLQQRSELGRELPEATLASTLGDAGWQTWAIYTPGIFYTDGEVFEEYRERDLGFAESDHESLGAAERTDRVLAFADRIADAGEPPSLMWVHYFDVHEPYEDTRYGDSDAERYEGEIRKVDEQFARLVEGLEQRLERDVVIAVTSDHGEEFREHGGIYHGTSLYEEQIRVPLLLRAPGLEAARVRAPARLVDLAPTLLALAGVNTPDTMRGDDLRELTGAEADASRAFASTTKLKMAVRWPHKLIANLRTGSFELYDLEADPTEHDDLSAEQPELRGELLSDLDGWLTAMRAPPGQGPSSDPRRVALDRARLGDRRAADGLASLVQDTSAPAAQRAEATRRLGALEAEDARAVLVEALDSDVEQVADEAAIALGRLGDARARDELRELVSRRGDRDVRIRAGIALGHLHDRRAVPALVMAAHAQDRERPERVEALSLLGELRDRRSVQPLIDLLEEGKVRFWVARTLGEIGDRRAVEPLLELLSEPQRTTIRGSIVRALGRLGDPRAIDAVARIASNYPDVLHTDEALRRLRTRRSGG